MSKLIHSYSFWLLLTACLMLLPHLGLIEVNIMEARNFITSREMVNHHNWIMTTINDLPRYEKPPLPTWITACFGAVLGFENIFGMRLPVVLITLLLLYSTFSLSKKMGLSAQQNFHNGLILITSFYIYFGGRDNQWDMYTHSFMMVCILFLWDLLNNDKQKTRNTLLAGLFFGFSLLSKGPVSLYALLLPFLIAYGCTYKFQLKGKKVYLLLLIIIGLLIGLSWPLYVRWADSETFSRIAAQESSRWGSYNIRPFYYYWSFFTQSGIWTIPAFTALFYPYLKNRVSNLKAYQFTVLWTLGSVILLSIIPEKKSRYLLPVLIPMALNTGFYIDYLIREFKNSISKAEQIIVNVTFGLIGVICIAIPLILAIKLKSDLLQYIFWMIGLTLSLVALCIFLFKNLKRKNMQLVFYAVVAVQVAVMVWGVPFSEAFFNNPEYQKAKNLKSLEELYSIKTYELTNFSPEIVWDYGSSIKILKNEANKLNLPQEDQFGLLATTSDSIFTWKELNNYNIRAISKVDLNRVPQSSKKHNSRLYRTYYLISKK